MKRVIVAIDDEKALTEERREYVEQLAKRENAEVIGVIKYPDGLILKAPEVFMIAVKEARIDTVVAISPEFVLSEFVNEQKISEMFAEENMKIIDATMDMELGELMESMPSVMKETLDDFLNPKSSEINNILLLVTEGNTDDGVAYAEGLLSEGKINKMSILTIPEYIPEMKEAINDIIQKERISKFVAYNISKSHAFTSLIEELSADGIEVIQDEKQTLNKDMTSNFFGMRMN